MRRMFSQGRKRLRFVLPSVGGKCNYLVDTIHTKISKMCKGFAYQVTEYICFVKRFTIRSPGGSGAQRQLTASNELANKGRLTFIKQMNSNANAPHTAFPLQSDNYAAVT